MIKRIIAVGGISAIAFSGLIYGSLYALNNAQESRSTMDKPVAQVQASAVQPGDTVDAPVTTGATPPQTAEVSEAAPVSTTTPAAQPAAPTYDSLMAQYGFDVIPQMPSIVADMKVKNPERFTDDAIVASFAYIAEQFKGLTTGSQVFNRYFNFSWQ